MVKPSTTLLARNGKENENENENERNRNQDDSPENSITIHCISSDVEDVRKFVYRLTGYTPGSDADETTRSPMVLPWKIENKYYSALVYFRIELIPTPITSSTSTSSDAVRQGEDAGDLECHDQHTQNIETRASTSTERTESEGTSRSVSAFASPVQIYAFTSQPEVGGGGGIEDIPNQLIERINDSQEVELSFAVLLPTSPSIATNSALRARPQTITSPEEYEDLFQSLGLDFLNLSGDLPESSDGNENGIEDKNEGLLELEQSLQTIMWPSMVRKTQGRKKTVTASAVESGLGDARTRESTSGQSAGNTSGTAQIAEERDIDTSQLRKYAENDFLDSDFSAFLGAGVGGDVGVGDRNLKQAQEPGFSDDAWGKFRFGEEEISQGLEDWLDSDHSAGTPSGSSWAVAKGKEETSRGEPAPGPGSRIDTLESKGEQRLTRFEDDFSSSDFHHNANIRNKEAEKDDGDDETPYLPLDPSPLLSHLQSTRSELSQILDEDERRVRAAREVERLFKSLGMDLGGLDLESEMDDVGGR